MAFFAIAKRYLSLIKFDFNIYSTPLNSPKIIIPKTEITKEELNTVINSPDQEWLVFDSLTTAKTVAILLSRLYTEDLVLVAPQIQQLGSAVIFVFESTIDLAKHAKAIDANTLALYPDLNTLPLYLFESTYCERVYCNKLLIAFKDQAKLPLPKFRLYTLDLEPTTAYFQDVTGEFRVKPLQPAVVLPFRLRAN